MMREPLVLLTDFLLQPFQLIHGTLLVMSARAG
jgi:hypothetical protein